MEPHENMGIHRLVRAVAQFTKHDAELALEAATAEQSSMNELERQYLTDIRDQSEAFLQNAVSAADNQEVNCG